MRRIHSAAAIMLVLGLFVGALGCSGKTAATAAVTAAQTAFDATKDKLASVMPEETQKLADAIAAAKADLDQGKYKEAMEAAKVLPAQVQQLGEAAAKKTEELTASWTSMSTELPAAISAVQSKVDALSKSKKLPAGMDKAGLAGIQNSLQEANQLWTSAQTAFKSGNLAEAMKMVGTIKTAIVGAMTALGIPVPAALQAA